MTNAELNQLSISELRELNRKVVEMVKLKMQFEGKINADNLEKGMIVKYKGSSDKLQGQKFVIEKISKVNAQCKSLRDNRTWNINLANIEPCKESVENEFFMNEKEPESGFQISWKL